MDKKPCSHEYLVKNPPARTAGCEKCLETGDSWVELRKCLVCGHVGCCDSSKNKHATKHFRASNHPVIESFRSSERWAWCYIDETYFEAPAIEPPMVQNRRFGNAKPRSA
ncbi:MAG: UBP-type zinc finger domain-containing protein [Bdellovibrionia bacterium]